MGENDLPSADRHGAASGASGPTIVGIGASAGGIEAFRAFFNNMPSNSGIAFVVVFHLPANRPSMLPAILGRWTSMPVREVHDGVLVMANTVYVPPPHANTVLHHGHLYVSHPPPEPPLGYRPIDCFFDTLATSRRGRSVGIILSGTGSDGALGLKAIRACGGLTIAQATTAPAPEQGRGPQHAAMPGAAAATGTVDLVAPAHEIPGHLIRLLAVKLDIPALGATGDAAEAFRQQVCATLRTQIGHDFSDHKDKTFLRRVNRRMQVLNLTAPAEYVALLRNDHTEVLQLFSDLLPRETGFFWDENVSDVIERVVIPRLFEGRQADRSVRVWVPGCASGEEAYSLAILLREHMDGLRDPPRVQVFATDVDEPAIDTARLGRYPTVLLDGLSDARRSRFFKRSNPGYVIAKEIRDLCTFSSHSLVRDPPFSRMDLISCRNLLTALTGDAQGKIISAFHYALAPRGTLILGSFETSLRYESLFDVIDQPARIFERRDVPSPPLHLDRREPTVLERRGQVMRPIEATSPLNQQDRHVPALPVPSGPGLIRRLDSGFRRIARAAMRLSGSSVENIESLRGELARTRGKLQAITEEHEAVLEELRCANEKLRSLNEELHPVNAQLSDDLDEFDRPTAI